MTFDEIKNICRTEIKNTDDFESLEFLDSINNLESKISNELSIDNFKVNFEQRDNNLCAIYSFNYNSKNKCRSGFIVDYRTFADDLAQHIWNINEGISAINILNNLEDYASDSVKGRLKIEYIWGYSDYCGVCYWDYENLVVKLSKKALLKLIELYENGEESFKINMQRALGNNEISNCNIIKAIGTLKDTEFGKFLGLEFESNADHELTKYMLNREEAIDFCNMFDKKSNLELYVVEVINQLGSFIALCKWEINFKKKEVYVRLVDERAIDLIENDIVSNYNICSRIEQSLQLSDKEKAKLFD